MITPVDLGGGAEAWLQYLMRTYGVSHDQAMTLAQQNPMIQKAVTDLGDGTQPPAPAQPPQPPPATPVQGGPFGGRPAPAPPNQFVTGGPELAAALSNSPRPGPPPQPAYNPLSGGSANTGQPYGGASASGAASNPRFVPITRPNADPIRGPYGGAGGPSEMSALNLAGMFQRPPAGAVGAPAAAPQGTVTVTRPPPGPLAQNPPMPPTKPADIAQAQIANAIRQPNWWGGYS